MEKSDETLEFENNNFPFIYVLEYYSNVQNTIKKILQCFPCSNQNYLNWIKIINDID